MSAKKTRRDDSADFRMRAEEIVRRKASRMQGKLDALSPEEVRQALYELQVHQIELEMQNEEMRRAREQLEVLQARYFDLYDLAPVGYCTVSEKGMILEANLTATTLLGMARSALANRPISQFILPEDRDICFRHRKQLFETGEPQACELRMVKMDGTAFWVHLEETAAQDTNGAPVCRIVLSDITERKRAEDKLHRNESRFRRLVDILQHPSETMEEFLDYALDQAIQLTESKIGYIYHYHEDRNEFVLNTWSKEVMAACAIPNPPACYDLDKTGIWGEAIRQRRSIIVNDFKAAHPLKKGYPEGHVQLLKFMTVPIFKGNRIVGVVGLANKETDYEETDVLQTSLLMEAVWKVTEGKRAEEALRESENKYRELSIVDGLTQLYNSRYFYHQLKMEMDRADRYGHPLTLMLLDLDDFKRFNDAYGHIEGDEVLMRLGQVVKRCLRRIDSAYRYGGEEFTIIMPMTTGRDGAVTAERIRTEFKDEHFSSTPGEDVHVTVSIGLAQYKKPEEIKSFVDRADKLMYQGKKNGKDRVCSES